MGEGVGEWWVGSCLRRNDGGGAGMTVGASGVNRLYAPGGGAIW